MPSRDLTCTLRLSFGSLEFGDISSQDLLCSLSSIPVQTSDMDVSYGPMDIMEETRIPVRKNNHKIKHCVAPVAAIKRRGNRDGDDAANGGLRPRELIRHRSSGT
ncbi:hypothetical protein FXO38_30073 [Capsicum annuum]|nr:hypothetical protein FXO38_30073 [Capsicum annuum]KAF3634074.1 hypothetical protein FXO37_26682 [Capsicum annuum]